MLLLSVTAMAQTTLVDFEGAPPTYEDFNSSVTTIIDNPDATAPNTSAKVAQNVVPAGASFAGVKITQPVSLADGKTFTMQVYSPIANTPVLLKFEGSIDPIERVATTGAANTWQEVSFSFEDEADLNFDFVVAFMNFNVVPGADMTFFFDNVVQIGGGGPSAPLTAAPTPTAPAAEVVSIFSDAYTNVMVDTYRTDWSVGDLLDTMIDGNATMKYTNLNFVGIETTTSTVDLATAGVTVMHLDYWSANGTAFAVKLVDAGMDGVVGGGDDVEHELNVTGLTRRAWNSIDLQLNDFTGLTTRSNIAQYILVGQPSGANDVYIDNIYFYVGAPVLDQMDLPVTFDEEGVDYGLVGFGGSNGSVVADPEDATNMVGQVIKGVGAALWAGVTITSTSDGPIGFSNRIPFTADATTITVRTWSPAAGINVRLKAEHITDPTISVETPANTLTTVAGGWETLTFDFATEASGTAAINLGSVYGKLSLFMDFGNDMPTEEATYYFDDVIFVGGGGGGDAQMDLPLTFDEAGVDYGLDGFGGSNGAIVADPEDAANMVGQVIKNAGAEVWAGVTMTSTDGGPDGFASEIPFAADATIITARVWSPAAGTNVLLKAEQTDDATVSVETSAMTTAAGWETLTFDFTNHADGTAALDLNAVYGKLSIFPGFGDSPAAETTYYFDDVIFVGGGGGDDAQMDLPVTFDDATIDYGLAGFGGSNGAIVADPEDATNMVGQVIKNAGAEVWAGVTMTSTDGGPDGFASEIPFAADATVITARVWSPAAGTNVLLKAEQTDDATVSVETSAMTTAAGWETLTFDFTNHADGTAALDLNAVYGKLSIFPGFGDSPAAETTYYFDDVIFVGGGGGGDDLQMDLPVTFDEADVDYGLAGFGNSNGAIVADPTDATNMVGEVIKSAGAETWAGVTMTSTNGGPDGFANSIPFAADATTITLRTWSPAAGINILLKAEQTDDATVSVETSMMTTVAGAWETITFDFTNHAAGTAALDLNAVYGKLSIFFDFGNQPAADATYYFDDVYFGDVVSTNEPLIGLLEVFPNPIGNEFTVVAPERMEALMLFSSNGQKLGEWQPNAERFNLDAGHLAPGMYVALARTAKGLMTIKLMKQ